MRATMMRGTLHAVTSADCLALRMLAQPTMERAVRTNTDYDGHQVAGVAVGEVLAVGAELLTEAPRTPAELRALCAARWPGHDPEPLGYAVRALVPTVQVPPRGIWGVGGVARLSPVRAWLGQPVHPDPDPAGLVPRYLAAFGPATAADLATWSGRTAVRPLLEQLRPRLRVFADEQGRELFDMPGAPLPPADTPAPVRLLAPYDNALLAHADRARVVPEEHRARLLSKNGIVPGTVLVDGFVQGTWEVRRERGRARLTVRPFRSLTAGQAGQLSDEAASAAEFAARDGPVEVAIEDPS